MLFRSGGQALPAVRGLVDVELVHHGESFCWTLPISVVTHESPDHDEVVLLGQSGFLEFFDVRFCGADHLLELKPNGSFPRRSKSR